MSSTLLCLVRFLYESSGFGDILNKWAKVSESALCVYIHEFVYWATHNILPCTHDDFIEICHCLFIYSFPYVRLSLWWLCK